MEVESKKRRLATGRGSRSRKEESGEQPAEGGPSSPAVATLPFPSSPEDSPNGEAAPEKPDPRRRKRRRRRKPATSRDQPEGAAERDGNETEASEEPSLGEPGAVASGPPSGREATSPDDDAEREVTEGDAADEDSPEGESEAASPSGRRRRRGRRSRGERERPPAVRPQEMLVAAGAERTQIVVLEEGELVEHYVARHEGRSIAGNVYLGQVQNVLPGMEAAFVDIGEGRNAVLYAGEVAFDEEIEGRPPRIETVLRSGQPVLTQVVKDPMGAKGARLSTEISLPGRYVVLIPETDSLGISRRLPDEERARLRDLAQEVRPESYGMIVRTAALGAGEEEIRRDVARLLERWHDIYQKAHRASPPQLVYSEPELVIRVVRDLFNRDVRRVIVNRPETLELIRSYISEVTPDLAERVELDGDEAPLLERFGVLEQIRKALDRRAGLHSGGHIVIDRTEAMTVIDVNTGRYVGRSALEETVFKTNLEAAEEIAKQLRLRDIGGIIIIDFIDMILERNREELVRVFRNALARDKTRNQVFGMTELGIVQMTRKNVSEGLLESFSQVCDKCQGTGVLLEDLKS